MALTNDQITAQNFKDFYGQIRPYLNGAAHSGFTPVGTVISVMGKTAPMNYLVCDGTIYNIADYSELANYFAEQFDAANFFGGDGTTTFAVPDLRGEFLRGTGTNSHTNQGSGAAVGTHQDGTISNGFLGGDNTKITIWADVTKNTVSNMDYNANGSDKKYIKIQPEGNSGAGMVYTSRPTNTSVLYCIAVKNIFMDAGCNYSTDELVVGTWVDGKPIYQKTFDLTSTVTAKDGSRIIVIHNIENIKNAINVSGYLTNSNVGVITIPQNFHNTSEPQNDLDFTVRISLTGIIYAIKTSLNIDSLYLTIQYTKTTD